MSKRRNPFDKIPPDMMADFLRAAAINANKHSGADIVIKYGAEVIRDEATLDDILFSNVTLKQMGCNVLNMHGGGSYIDAALREKGIEPKKVAGKRVCDEEVRDVALETLRTLNLKIVQRQNLIAAENQIGDQEILGQGEGGFNGGFIKATPETEGQFTGINPIADAKKLIKFRDQSVIPIFYSICSGPNSKLLNVNADDAATALLDGINRHAIKHRVPEREIKESRQLMCSDVRGVEDREGVMGTKGQLITSIFTDQISFLTGKIETLSEKEKAAFAPEAIVKDGMIPKLESAGLTAESGKGRKTAVIIMAAGSGNILRELFTEQGSGTMVTARTNGTRNELDDYIDAVARNYNVPLIQRHIA